MELTPIEQHGDLWLKRDDTYNICGAHGGKARTCWRLCNVVTTGLVTAGSRNSPQINIVAHMAKHLGLPFIAHTSTGDLGDEINQAKSLGAQVVQHRPGYNTVIVRRAKDDAAARGYQYIPFGMECREAVEETAQQVAQIPSDVKRIVVPVGSGMTFAGILHGIEQQGLDIPVVGVKVGANPAKRLEQYAPKHWREMSKIIDTTVPYHKHVMATIGGTLLDPVYEAKCVEFLKPGDLLWVVGIRSSKISI
jgi:1-aminocyclopropane-1-carboxylate deaminase/D-cysteine desulfhydrase-like pyridoxal-dependent ACC family enzyme